MKRFYLIILLFSTHPLFAQSPLSAKLDSFFRGQPANGPGIALSIEKNGKVIYRRTAGLADLETRTPLDSNSNFRLASLTKQFTAMGILLLQQQQKLAFDDPIGRWLPELPAGIGNGVSIAHLLTHSSGILDYESLIPPTQTRQLSDTDVLHLLQEKDTTYFPPGTQFRYSNSGFCLLALIIERVSHQSYATFIKERIFRRLHMDSSTVYESGHPIPHRAMGYAKDSTGRIIASDQSITSATKGDGGIYTSLADYSKWLWALRFNTREQLPLPYALMTLRMPVASGSHTYYSSGWFVSYDYPVQLFHSGSTCGFATFVIQVPAEEWSLTYFSNLAENTDPFRDILTILKDTGTGDYLSLFGLHALTR